MQERAAESAHIAEMPKFICVGTPGKLTPNAAPHEGCWEARLRYSAGPQQLERGHDFYLLFERPHVWFGVSSSISSESLRSTRRTEAGMFVPVLPPLKTRPHCHVLQLIACILYR